MVHQGRLLGAFPTAAALAKVLVPRAMLTRRLVCSGVHVLHSTPRTGASRFGMVFYDGFSEKTLVFICINIIVTRPWWRPWPGSTTQTRLSRYGQST